MKKSNIQKTKLTKSELKEVNGGALLICPAGLCIPKGGTIDDAIRGTVGKGGYCC